MKNIQRKKHIERLSLTKISEGLKVGTRKNGTSYSVRDDRSRYFFPNEWTKFYNFIKKDKQPIFDCLINTGARIEEALNIRPKDFDFDRNNLTLAVTKIKAKKGESVGKRRSFTISSQFTKRMKKYINDRKISDESVLFSVSKQSVWKMLRTKLKKLEVKDWYNFSLHNIRKTHGMWLKTLISRARQGELDSDEICMRLGHDHNTYLKHYMSPSIFTDSDRDKMVNILGDVYGLR